mmetsp:Transcript_5800/g.20833  ORF Transcript_5800/g.20833 Transcript_5800/m.20833 type:complete len:312 (-) Transcript_5800:797-1732(-)
MVPLDQLGDLLNVQVRGALGDPEDHLNAVRGDLLRGMRRQHHQAPQYPLLDLWVLLDAPAQREDRIRDERHLVVPEVGLQLLQELRDVILGDDLGQNVELEALDVQRVTCPDKKTCIVGCKDAWEPVRKRRHAVQDHVLRRGPRRPHAEHQGLGASVVLVRWGKVELESGDGHDSGRVPGLQERPRASQQQPVILCHQVLGMSPPRGDLRCGGGGGAPGLVLTIKIVNALYRLGLRRLGHPSPFFPAFTPRPPVRVHEVLPGVPVEEVERRDLGPLVHVNKHLADLSKAVVDGLQPLWAHRVEDLARRPDH